MNPDKKARLMKDTTICERADCIDTILQSIPTEDASRDGLIDTPLRVASMYNELFSG